MYQSVYSGKISGNGLYTNKCQDFFKEKYRFSKCLLTSSCTDALEMCALLANVKEGDEIIVPAYTFVSTANAFVLQGAKIVFADSYSTHPNVDPSSIKRLINDRTKAIVVVHYAGVACDMGRICEIALEHNLYVIEDAAQAIDSYYKGQPLGGIGDLGAFSFHETKNIISGEGGMLTINNKAFHNRAEIIWEKGTNRSAFFRGETEKYEWIDYGSSYLPSEIISSFLFAQLECLEEIQARRKSIWQSYHSAFVDLQSKEKVKLPFIPDYATNNAHMYYILCRDKRQRDRLLSHLNEKSIYAVFHYLSLNKSSFYLDRYKYTRLPNAEFFEESLIRLPLYFELPKQDQEYIVSEVHNFFCQDI